MLILIRGSVGSDMDMPSFELSPIAIVESPFKEKFGIPRQAGLVSAAVGSVRLLPPYDEPAACEGLEGFSHVWLSYRFHAIRGQDWQPRVRPPRLGGNRAVGVFASRSPFRPNRLGLSAVRLLDVDLSRGVRLRIGGLDLLDGTPVFDIKPYVPYSDAIASATGGFAGTPPEPSLDVRFSDPARTALDRRADAVEFEALIRGVLALDPRPAYQHGSTGERIHGMRLEDVDVRWRVDVRGVEVVALTTP